MNDTIHSHFHCFNPRQLCFCTGKTEEDFLVGDKVLDPTLVYVDETSSQLHTDSAQYNEVKLFLALRQLFESCGYYEFGSRDLYGTPTPKRLQQQLSAICNLAGNFYDEQIKVFAELNYTVRTISDNYYDAYVMLTVDYCLLRAARAYSRHTPSSPTGQRNTQQHFRGGGTAS